MTNKQAKFIEEYLICLNGAEAARRAGYKPKNAHIIATQNLSKLYIKKAIEEKQAEIQRKYNISRDRYIQMTIQQWEEEDKGSNKTALWSILGKAAGHLKDGHTVNAFNTVITDKDKSILARYNIKPPDGKE